MLDMLAIPGIALSILWLWVICYKLGKASKKFRPRAVPARIYRRGIEKVGNDLWIAFSSKFEKSLPDVLELESENGDHSVIPPINFTTRPGRVRKH